MPSPTTCSFLVLPGLRGDERSSCPGAAIFPAAGAEPYKRDLENLQYHLLDTGHFALETHGPEIASLMRDFLQR